jgi:hypothetical protein
MREYMRARRDKAQNGAKVLIEAGDALEYEALTLRGSESLSDGSEAKLEVVVENGRMRRGDEIQEFGVGCPDCYDRDAPLGQRWLKDPGTWCYSEQHPTFDRKGYLVRMSKPRKQARRAHSR